MRKISIIILSCLVIFNCSKSPDSLVEKAEKFVSESEYDNAIKTFQSIVDNFPDDSLARVAEYNIAWIELNNNNNYPRGYELLNEIKVKYPDYQIGKSASDDVLNLPAWLISKSSELRTDTTLTEAIGVLDYLVEGFSEHPIIPEALYLKGNIYLNDQKDFYRALNTYQEIVHKYQGSNFEPMSQFMIGYIHANVLSDLPKAKLAYSTFLEKYPEHELAPSVQFELEYLGRQIQNIDELKTRDN